VLWIVSVEQEVRTPEEEEIFKVMGFCAFDTTKGKNLYPPDEYDDDDDDDDYY
jgi:Protein of unknown function (DUF1777).